MGACSKSEANEVRLSSGSWQVHHTAGELGLVGTLTSKQADRIVGVAVDPPLRARMVGATTREAAGHLGHLDGDGAHKDPTTKGIVLDAGDNAMTNHGPHVEVSGVSELAPSTIRVTFTLESGGEVEVVAPVGHTDPGS